MANQAQNNINYIDGIRAGHADTLKQLYIDFFPRIAQFIQSNNGTEEDARDVFQDAIIVIYRNVQAHSFRLTSSFYTYLYSIARNIWFKKLRKSYTKRVTITENVVFTDGDNLEELLYEHEQYKLYQSKFQLLSDGCRELLQLAFEGKSTKEITAIMELSSEQYTRKRKFKCKEKLIRLIRSDVTYKQLKSVYE